MIKSISDGLIGVVLLTTLGMAMPFNGSAASNIHVFQNTKSGSLPNGPLLVDSKGVLYGVTQHGGGLGTCATGCGTIFTLTPPASGSKWIYSVIARFDGSTGGALPLGGLVMDPSGDIFGVTKAGGNATNGQAGGGVIYKLSPTSKPNIWTKSILYNFPAAYALMPAGSLVLDRAGNLYGELEGSVYELVKPAREGGWTFRYLYQFGSSPDGSDAVGAPFFDASGNLYGLTRDGGVGGYGTVFQLAPPMQNGGAWTETILFSLPGGSMGASPTDVISDGSTGLYLATLYAGDYSDGAIFHLMPSGNVGEPWAETELSSFPYDEHGAPDKLYLSAKGTLYGTASDSVFKLAQTQHGMSYNLKFLFESADQSCDPRGGIYGLALGANGGFYGAVTYGGSPCVGTVFTLPPFE